MLHASRRIRNHALTAGRFNTRRRTHHDVSLLEELEGRGFVSQSTRPELLKEHVQAGQRVVYSGIDPTAASLHVGHILPMMCLVHFHVRGHRVVPLIGGATALIGDPSGRSTERPLMEQAKVEDNITRLKPRVQKFFERALEYAQSRHVVTEKHLDRVTVLNNIDWFDKLGVLEFLSVAGTTARVNSMLSRESVQSRLNSQQGISFAEFSYQLMQAYDFLALNKKNGCTIQVGGSDQWGNIVAGVELLNRAHGSPDDQAAARDKGFGITTPLLTTASGEKFGKSAGNAVWLDEKMTSIYDFYQFFLRTPDEDVGRYLKLFTLLPLQRINEALSEHMLRPERRAAQKLLADEVTELVHTAQGVHRAQSTTQALFGTDVSDANADDILAALAGDPRLHVAGQKLMETSILKLAVDHGLVTSNGAARKLIALKGLYVNGKPVTKDDQRVKLEDLIGERLVILRVGKSNHAVLTVHL
ncbi:hypothetical protein BV25DRAFT_1868421 [Artomyces pyxidatus]|uniref:Uncharacterized protein n=1 Tax=Artomyces pyxidatus TaxID=48021 RepID=A0ACB8TD60_9AGAM|nr:hypothetical protein BV25DRAFT_1868421 [Artomyces pyxidatus]